MARSGAFVERARAGGAGGIDRAGRVNFSGTRTDLAPARRSANAAMRQQSRGGYDGGRSARPSGGGGGAGGGRVSRPSGGGGGGHTSRPSGGGGGRSRGRP
jgi:hypothetical protein